LSKYENCKGTVIAKPYYSTQRQNNTDSMPGPGQYTPNIAMSKEGSYILSSYKSATGIFMPTSNRTSFKIPEGI